VRREGNYTDADAPTEEEDNKRFIQQVILRDPTLFASQAVREYLGIDIPDVMPQLTTPPPPPPAPGRLPTAPEPGQMPEQPAITDQAAEHQT
jgi:hypothetical protein